MSTNLTEPPPPEESTSTVYIVDDDIALNAALCNLVKSIGLAVHGFTDAGTFLATERNHAGPSCLVLDVRLHGVTSGIALQRELNARGDPIPVIFISAHGDVSMCVQVMKAGAVDFLPKPLRDQDLLDAIWAALERDRKQRAALNANADIAARYERLSEREREVMQLATSGMVNRQIAQCLGISDVTVKIHRSNLMRKMQASSFADLVVMAYALRLIRLQFNQSDAAQQTPWHVDATGDERE
ncbi:response regulator transcription factor [Paraburkholderia jirisanensis]